VKTTNEDKARLVAIDHARVLVVASVVFYHCLNIFRLSVEPLGGLVANCVEALLWISSIPQNEVLIFISMYLLALGRQVNRSAIPWTSRIVEAYLAWTLIYVFTGIALHQPSPIDGGNIWVGILFTFAAGGAKYHLHFFPALFAAAALVSVIRRPLPPAVCALLAIGAALVRYRLEQEVTSFGTFELLYLHVLKIVSYLPFALLGASLATRGALQADISTSASIAATVAFAFAAIGFGLTLWVDDARGMEFFLCARTTAVVALAYLLAGGRRVPSASAGEWRPLRTVAERSFAIFMIHPLLTDLLMMGLRTAGLTGPAALGILVFVTAVGSYLIAGWMRRVPYLREIS
jgi:surface polysaccharide O-acyltransferase-like enzyme